MHRLRFRCGGITKVMYSLSVYHHNLIFFAYPSVLEVANDKAIRLGPFIVEIVLSEFESIDYGGV